MDFYELLLAKKLNGGGGGGQWTTDGIGQGLEPNGDIVFNGTELSDYAFAGKPITSFTAPNVVYASGLTSYWWFCKCPELKTISMPLARTFSLNMNNATFGELPLLEHLYLPSVKKIPAQSLTQMPKLKAVAFPSVTSIDLNGLQTTGSGIETVDLGKNLGSIVNYNAPGNTVVNMILRKDDGVVPCTNVGGLANRLMNYYIPKALYDHLGDGTAMDYQSASNWVTRYNSGYCNFIQIEGTQYENYYADGTPIGA